MRLDAAIIGGTGVGDVLDALGGFPIHQPTPFGVLRGRVIQHGAKAILLIRRHADGHKVPPHRVNYRAMAAGCKALGVPLVLATAAVGSMRKEWDTGTVVVATDYWEATARNCTMWDHEVVHTDCTDPFPYAANLIEAANQLGIPIVDHGVYVGGNGPRYETKAEIREMAQTGDIVGMTAATEAIVLAEVGIPMGLICVVTNLATGLADKPHEHEEVARQMTLKSKLVVDIVLRTVENLP